LKPFEPPPKIDLIDIEVPVKPAPPPPIEQPKVAKSLVKPAIAPPARRVQSAPPKADPLPPQAPQAPVDERPDPGGAPVYKMDDIAPGAVGTMQGAGTRKEVGRGGTGTGTASGVGSGSEPTRAVSVATIKTRAMPRGDYDYVSTKDYPAEARQLGI